MTVVVGLRCSDGVVLGADSSATFGPHAMMKTIEQAVQKVFVIEDRYIFAGTGEIGLAQRFEAVIKKAHLDKRLRGSHIEVGKEICRAARDDFGSTGVEKGAFWGATGLSGSEGDTSLRIRCYGYAARMEGGQNVV